jgi:D-alanyl-D-alanine dipeptidase
MASAVETDRAFTSADYRGRIERVAAAAVDAGLAGVLITPGPDLLWLTGYRPTAITERLTMLIVRPDREPTMVVPVLERPDAEAAEAASVLSIVDWADGDDPYRFTGTLLQPDGRFGVSDSAWSMHLLGLQRELPASAYRSLTESLPMLRAVKDDGELSRLAVAGAAADAAYQEILGVGFAGRRENDVAADLAELLRRFGHEQVDFTVVGSGPNGANPHHEAGDRVIQAGDVVVLDFGGLMNGYGSDTTRTVCVGEPSTAVIEVHDIVQRAQQTAFEAVRPGVSCEVSTRLPAM